MKKPSVVIATVLMLLSAMSLFAQTNEDQNLRARVETLEEQVRILQSELARMRESQAVSGVAAADVTEVAADPDDLRGVELVDSAPATVVEASASPHHPAPSAPTSRTSFNPDIGFIGNLIGAAGEAAESPAIAALPSWTLQESEASFQAVIDPYARADFFLAFGEEGVEVEEGYASFTALPAGMLLRAGKMRANFGRLNAFHNHTLPWADRPIVMFNLLGGATDDPDTGIKDTGVSVSRLFQAGPAVIEATAEVFRGDSGTLFQASKRSDVSAIGHLKGYFDISEASNVELGLSGARGHNDGGSDFLTSLYGADLTFRWRPLQRAIYHSFAARSELIWSRREQASGDQDAFGWYASADYQFARRWIAGVRFDESDRASDADLTDRGTSAVLTFRPSEFSQIRWQWRRSEFAGQSASDELLLQLLFTIGAHGAHPF
ncbi:MAG: hypothetical protein NDJ92_10775 [Thermoanaerobaculia bacterium]|nr:hypothetical protein [Thermoanaerobaculia bacterium]